MNFSMIFSAVDRSSKVIGKIQKGTEKLKGVAKGVGKISLRAGKLAAKGLMVTGIALTTILGASTKAAIGFESAMADVRKVADFKSPQEFKAFGADILAMSTRIPITAKGLAEISAEAAAAGIVLKDNLRFTEFTAKSAVAFDMAAGAAGDSFAKIRNVYKLNQTGLEDMADATNHLSNSMASKAPQIVDFLTRAGGAAPLLKMSATQMAAFGSALIATGTAPETAARGVNAMAVRLEIGGKKVSGAMKAIGLDLKVFRGEMAKDPGAAMRKLFDAINKSPKGTKALKALVGQDFVDDFLKLSGNAKLLAKAFDLVTDKTKMAGSVGAEYATRAATTANSLELMQNNIQAIGIAVGTKLLPPLNVALAKISEFMLSMQKGTSGLSQSLDAVGKFWVDFGASLAKWRSAVSDSLSGAGEALSKVGATISRIVQLFSGEDSPRSFGTLIGSVVAGAFTVLAKAVEIAATGIDWVLRGAEGLASWFAGQSFDWASMFPDLSLWENIKSIWSGAKAFFGGIWAAITPEAGWLSALTDGWAMIKSSWSGATAFFGEIWNGVSSGFASYVEPIAVRVASIGEKLGSVFDKLGQIGTKIGSLFPEGTGTALATVAAALGTIAGFSFDIVLTGLELLVTGIDSLLSYFTGAPADWSNILPDFSGWTMPTLDITAITATWSAIKKLFDWSPLEALDRTFGGIPGKIGGYISQAADLAGAGWNRLKGVFSDGETDVSIAVRDPASIERATQAATALQGALNGAKSVDMSGVSSNITKLIAQAAGLKTAVAAGVGAAQSYLAGQSFHHHGVRMMDTMAAGMKARAQVVVAQIRATMQEVRNHLPSSPAKVGPLSDIHRLKFGETIARSIKAAPMVKAMRVAAAATMAAASPTGVSMALASTATPAVAARSAMPSVEKSRAMSVPSSTARNGGAGSGQNQKTRAPVSVTYGDIIIPGAGPADQAKFKEMLAEHARDIKRIVDGEDAREKRKEF